MIVGAAAIAACFPSAARSGSARSTDWLFVPGDRSCGSEQPLLPLRQRRIRAPGTAALRKTSHVSDVRNTRTGTHCGFLGGPRLIISYFRYRKTLRSALNVTLCFVRRHVFTAGCNQPKTCINSQYCVFIQHDREVTMEHLVRVHNEKDRRTLEWLRRHVGDAALAAAVERCAGSGKPYLSAVCRRLGVRVPDLSVPRRQTSSPIAEHSLATIRRILAVRTTPAKLVAGC